MRGWTGARLLLVGVVWGSPVAAQLPRRELGVALVLVGSDPVYAGLGVSGGLHLGNELRAVGAMTVGGAGGEVVVRGDAELQFVVDPFGRGRARLFAGAGLSGVTGPNGGGYLLVVAGIEGAPRARRGWSVELGIGGGARLAVGYRFRWAARNGRR